MPTFIGFILVATGAFVCWSFNGFKGEFNDEMVGPYDRSPKRTRNMVIGTIVLLTLTFIVSRLFDTSNTGSETVYIIK